MNVQEEERTQESNSHVLCPFPCGFTPFLMANNLQSMELQRVRHNLASEQQ